MCEAAYAESTEKIALSLGIKKMVSDSNLRVQQPISEHVLKMRARYPKLGSGELESLAYAVHCKEETGDNPIVISDDQRARKTAKDLGVPTISMLDFLRKAHELGILTTPELRKLVPELSQHMWITEKLIQDFLSSFR